MGLRFVGFCRAAHGGGARFREEPRGESSPVLDVEWGRAPRISGGAGQPPRRSRAAALRRWDLRFPCRKNGRPGSFSNRGAADNAAPSWNDLGNYELHRVLRLPTKHVRKWSKNRGGCFGLGAIERRNADRSAAKDRYRKFGGGGRLIRSGERLNSDRMNSSQLDLDGPVAPPAARERVSREARLPAAVPVVVRAPRPVRTTSEVGAVEPPCTFAEAAHTLGISLRQFRRLVDAGRIAFVKVRERSPRIRPSELHRFLAAPVVQHSEVKS